MNCCQKEYSEKFSEKKAKADLNDYSLNGIRNNSGHLVKELKKLDVSGKSLLDIGGGVGVTIFELFKAGIRRAIHVELSEHYSSAFSKEAIRQGIAGNTLCLLGDFTRIHDQVEPCDLVCLDKVICCYENYKPLVLLSIAKASRWYACVIPKDVWWVKFADQVSNFIKLLMRDKFRTYVHPVAEIERLVISSGFVKIAQNASGPWLTTIFKKEIRMAV